MTWEARCILSDFAWSRQLTRGQSCVISCFTTSWLLVEPTAQWEPDLTYEAKETLGESLQLPRLGGFRASPKGEEVEGGRKGRGRGAKEERGRIESEHGSARNERGEGRERGAREGLVPSWYSLMGEWWWNRRNWNDLLKFLNLNSFKFKFKFKLNLNSFSHRCTYAPSILNFPLIPLHHSRLSQSSWFELLKSYIKWVTLKGQGLLQEEEKKKGVRKGVG